MADLSDLIAPDAVLPDAAVPSVHALFAALGTAAGGLWGLDARLVADRLAMREKLGSTGFGGGVALPHAKLDGLDRVRGMFVRLARPLNYDAVDDMPIDIVIALMSPSDAGANHLKALAKVSRHLRDRALVERLRGAGSRDAIYALLSTGDECDRG